MGGKVTIKCPWHAYHIAVETGEGLYMGMDMALDARGRSQPSPPKVKSKGVKQRTHFVEVRDDEDVFVADSSLIPGTSSCAMSSSGGWRLTSSLLVCHRSYQEARSSCRTSTRSVRSPSLRSSRAR